MAEPPGLWWLQPFLKKMGASLPPVQSSPGSVLVPTCLHPEMAVLTVSAQRHVLCPAAPHWALPSSRLVAGLCGHGVHIRRWQHAAVPTIAHVFLSDVLCGVTAFILHFLLEFEGGISLGEEGLVASEAASTHICTLVWT